jgi:hypothetical protein
MTKEIQEFERHPIKYLGSNMGVALGLVLIWRGLWYGLDAVDMYFLGGVHWITAVFGVILGILILYLPHRNLKALERL